MTQMMAMEKNVFYGHFFILCKCNCFWNRNVSRNMTFTVFAFNVAFLELLRKTEVFRSSLMKIQTSYFKSPLMKEGFFYEALNAATIHMHKKKQGLRPVF